MELSICLFREKAFEIETGLKRLDEAWLFCDSYRLGTIGNSASYAPERMRLTFLTRRDVRVKQIDGISLARFRRGGVVGPVGTCLDVLEGMSCR